MMNMMSLRELLGVRLCLCLVLCFCLSDARKVRPSNKIRAANLGGWLVTEGWIKPSLFDGIPNNDLLDGTGLELKSVTTGKYLSAESGGGKFIVTNTTTSNWRTFKLWRINETTFNFRVYNKQFMGLDKGTGAKLVAVANLPGPLETFEIVRNSEDKSRVRIKASNGFYLQVKNTEDIVVSADSQGGKDWEDPSVFVITISSNLRGEFQVTNGYGPDKAKQVMTEHWRTYITKKDFNFMSKKGVNAVRIPVGWWIASDPSPPWPYVGGSLHALDNAFSWSEKYGIKVIIDLHAAPGSQNGFQHSSPRDGSQEWGQTDESINQTVGVIDFLASRYAKRPSLYAIELLNEPLAPVATLETVTEYYKAGYEAVRRHSSTAYVLLSNRIASPTEGIDVRELFPLASRLQKSVVDVHYYNLFYDIYKNITVQQNLNIIRTNRTAELNYLTKSSGISHPLVFVGEWAAEWETTNATEADYKRYGQVQKEVYDRATFGWGYFTLKNVLDHWSLEWMIRNGYIKLN